MKQTINLIGYGIVMFVIVDVLIVMFTTLQIGNGVETPHIGWWDSQIGVVVSLLK